MTEGPGRRLSQRIFELRQQGRDALQPLPAADELAAMAPPARREALDGLRLELYALAALLADDTVQRARGGATTYPPYGLAKSKFAQWGMLQSRPEPYEEGSIDSFYALWKGYVDTLVLHLHDELGEQRKSAQAWRVERVGELLPLFTLHDPKAKARMADPITFIYGGLQFGASVCVQLTEVMARLLRDVAELSAGDTAAVIARSTGPAFRLAALNLDQALPAYTELVSSGTGKPTEGAARPGWMDTDKFRVQTSDGGPWKIVLREETAAADSRPLDEAAAHRTLGCPARLSPDGGSSPIGSLWAWCVDIAHQTRLLAADG